MHAAPKLLIIIALSGLSAAAAPPTTTPAPTTAPTTAPAPANRTTAPASSIAAPTTAPATTPTTAPTDSPEQAAVRDVAIRFATAIREGRADDALKLHMGPRESAEFVTTLSRVCTAIERLRGLARERFGDDAGPVLAMPNPADAMLASLRTADIELTASGDAAAFRPRGGGPPLRARRSAGRWLVLSLEDGPTLDAAMPSLRVLSTALDAVTADLAASRIKSIDALRTEIARRLQEASTRPANR